MSNLLNIECNNLGEELDARKKTFKIRNNAEPY